MRSSSRTRRPARRAFRHRIWLEMVLVLRDEYRLVVSPGGGTGFPDNRAWGEERCESGRIGLTANELTWETGSEGSNPSLSAVRCFTTSKTMCRDIGDDVSNNGCRDNDSYRVISALDAATEAHVA